MIFIFLTHPAFQASHTSIGEEKAMHQLKQEANNRQFHFLNIFFIKCSDLHTSTARTPSILIGRGWGWVRKTSTMARPGKRKSFVANGNGATSNDPATIARLVARLLPARPPFMRKYQQYVQFTLQFPGTFFAHNTFHSFHIKPFKHHYPLTIWHLHKPIQKSKPKTECILNSFNP